MKNLTKEQLKQKAQIAQALAEVGTDLKFHMHFEDECRRGLGLR
jgi:hypothetical protein